MVEGTKSPDLKNPAMDRLRLALGNIEENSKGGDLSGLSSLSSINADEKADVPSQDKLPTAPFNGKNSLIDHMC